MSTASPSWVVRAPSRLVIRLPRPRRLLRIVLLALLLTIALALVSTVRHLEIPAPSGPFAVGRERISWTDPSRPERHTATSADSRVVPAQLWYPAEPGTGRQTSYVDGLDAVADTLVERGDLSAAAAWGLRWVRHHSYDSAAVAASAPTYPVVVLSPGNATNVAFYATTAEELASHGFIVVGLDHPFQVAAVAVPDGTVAAYDDRAEREGEDPGAAVAAKVDERVDDIAFVLERLGASSGVLEDRFDMDRIGVIGHSNGGLAAAEACRRLEQIRACANLDGQGAGGPFSTVESGTAPEQPFLFLTKESRLHPVLGERFEAAGEGAYRVVIPAAAHDQFADGALFRPSLNPFTRTVDRVATTSARFLTDFLDVHLRNAPEQALGDVPASTDIYVNAYPLGDRPPIPAS